MEALVVPAAAGGLVLTALFLRLTMGRAPAWLAGLALKLIGRDALEAGERLPRRRIAAAFGMHVFGRLVGLVEVAVVLSALGVHAGWLGAVGIGGILLVSGVVSLIVPMGIGVLEAASVFALGLAGAPPHVGLAFGLLRRGRVLFYAVIGVGLHLIAGRLRRRELMLDDRQPDAT
jgi:uncharacterized membrane protein YbhN (UPF0104 family)